MIKRILVKGVDNQEVLIFLQGKTPVLTEVEGIVNKALAEGNWVEVESKKLHE